MNRLERTLFRLDDDLRALGAEWALVGGLAIGARARPRTTFDIDVTVAVSGDAQAEALVRALFARGYRLLADLENTEHARLQTVRLLPPGEEGFDAVIVDLLFASTGVEDLIVAAAEPVALAPDLTVPVARIGHLVVMKVLAGRGKDVDDVYRLREQATPGDIEMARATVAEIVTRGYNRGKDLAALLERALEEPSYDWG